MAGTEDSMTGATHLLTGKFTRRDSRISKIVALALAFSSHFLLDHIPHFELSLPWQIILLGLATVFLISVALGADDFLILLGGFAGLLPDLIVNLGFWPAFTRMHNYFHFHLPYRVPSGLIYLEFCLDIVLIVLLAGGARLVVQRQNQRF
jgi:hypothetical protein